MNKVFLLLAIVIFLSCNSNDSSSKTKLDTLGIVSPYLQQKIAFADTATDVNKLLQVVDVLDSANKISEAVEVMNKVLASDSLNSFFWLRKGQLLKQTIDTPKAIKMFEYASKIYADAPQLMEWANLLAETGNPKTLQVTKVLRNNNPSKKYDAQAYFFDGVYYAKVNNIALALTNFNTCIARDYLLMDAYIEKGYIYFQEKKYDVALQVFKQSTTANLRFADGYYWQAKCFEALGDKEEAKELYKQALVLDKSIIEAAEALERIK
ncbi:MAG: tetratricopeptide repeat protein [Chitinophagaceae bacterium]